jgi:hypothetical protein
MIYYTYQGASPDTDVRVDHEVNITSVPSLSARSLSLYGSTTLWTLAAFSVS